MAVGTFEIKPFEKGKDESPSLAARILKPEATVYTKEGKVIYSAAPYGKPENRSGAAKLVGFGLTFLILGGAFGAGRISKRLR